MMSEIQLREYPWQVGLRFFQGIVQVVFLLILARFLSPVRFWSFRDRVHRDDGLRNPG